ncbi:hypothetical protein L3X38_009148 [Prunus dulcis]|uniref:Transducin/WD40 repeat-like superfamily protein n=1 Tax=Prunus dulcis TaxID=3755 RepID=A0AAD5F7T8_PRUDU|nr:hypothetical protein L3X38_009148 [Prunus dulcis]
MQATPKVHRNLWKPRSGLELMNNDLSSTNPEEEAVSCFSLICPTLETKVVVWNMGTLQTESTPEGHSSIISDVRFRPNSTQLTTSSFDTTVRLWDASEPITFCSYGAVDANEIMVDAKRDDSSCPDQITLITHCYSSEVHDPKQAYSLPEREREQEVPRAMHTGGGLFCLSFVLAATGRCSFFEV